MSVVLFVVNAYVYVLRVGQDWGFLQCYVAAHYRPLYLSRKEIDILDAWRTQRDDTHTPHTHTLSSIVPFRG